MAPLHGGSGGKETTGSGIFGTIGAVVLGMRAKSMVWSPLICAPEHATRNGELHYACSQRMGFHDPIHK